MGFIQDKLNDFKEYRGKKRLIRQQAREDAIQEKVYLERISDQAKAEEKINKIREKAKQSVYRKDNIKKSFLNLIKSPSKLLTSDGINKITGHKDNPAKFFFWTLTIMVVITISAATNGYPLRFFANISAIIMSFVIGGLNFFFAMSGGDLLDDFIIYSYQIFLTGYFGIILNVLWIISILRKTTGILSIFTNMLKWSFYWIWILMALNIIYTGNLFGVAQSPISLCGLHQNININTGFGDPVACDPIELEAFLTESVDRANNNALLSGVFSSFETREDGGVYFRSENVENYNINENAGASISNIEYSKTYFTSYNTNENDFIAEDLVIIGQISADKLILDSTEEIEVELLPELDPRSCIGIEEIVHDEFLGQLTGNRYTSNSDSDSLSISNWCNQDWSCNINNAIKSDSEKNKFILKNNQNTKFECRRDGLSIDREKITLANGKLKYPSGLPIITNLNFLYNTEAIATKQIFVMDREVIINQNDPLAYFNIEKALTNSKSITDKKIDIGIGTLDEEDYIQPNYKDNSFPSRNSIAISIKNPASSGGTIRNMNVELRVYPGSDNIEFICDPINYLENSNNEFSFNNPCTIGQISSNFEYKGKKSSEERDNSLYHLFEIINEVDINSGETYTADINSIISSDILENSDYQGIFIEGLLEYKYELNEQIRGSIRESQ
ncbi:MAG: hypothetical protein VW380_01450 [Candidatus Woesearchaeota archaeon]